MLPSCTYSGKSYFPKGRSEPLLAEDERKKLEKELNLDGVSGNTESNAPDETFTSFDEL